MRRLKNRFIAKILTRFPNLINIWVKKATPLKAESTFWTPLKKDLKECTVAIITTAGVHIKSQPPFNMKDPDGDPTYREIPASTPSSELMITHDYYDHKDADKDINIVFPIDRLREMKEAGIIKKISDVNFGLMGHIEGGHLTTFINSTANEISWRLKNKRVDIALLTPG